METKWIKHVYGDRNPSLRKIVICTFYSGRTITQKVRGSRSPRTIYAEKENYPVRGKSAHNTAIYSTAESN